MAISNLTGQKTYQSFRNLMQISSSGQVYDGLGNLVTSLQLTSSFVSGSSGASGAGFPFSGSAVITGSLLVSGSLTVTGSLRVSGSITGSLFGTASFAISGGNQNFQQVTNAGSSSTNTITLNPTASATGLNINTTYVEDAGNSTAIYLNLAELSTGININASPNDAVPLYINGNANGTSIYINSSHTGIQLNNPETGLTIAGTDLITGIYINNPNGDYGIQQYIGSGSANSINLGSTAKGIVINSGLSSTGNFIELNKNGVDKLIVNQEGAVTATSFTGSLFGTSSWASNSVSSSFAVSSSRAVTASFAQGGNGSFSGSFSGSGANLNSIPTTAIVGNFTQIATGSVTASVTPTQFSVVSGSMTEFLVTGTGVTLGGAITDTHRVTGSLLITGSNTVIGNETITGSLTVSSSNATQFLVGNSNLFVSSSGNVGIGTTSPTNTLEILSNITASLRIFGTGSSQILVVRANTPSRTGFIRYPSNYQIGTAGSDPLQFLTDNAVRMHINDTTGFVGIGTTSPTAKLEVNGPVIITVSASAASTIPLQITSGSTSLLFVSSSGRVGIGTTTPSSSLDVSGSARITNGLTVTSSLVVNGTSTLSNGQTTIQGSSATTGNALVVSNSTPSTILTVQNNGQVIITGSTTSTQGFIKPGAGSQYLLADGTTTASTGGSPFPYTGSAQITGSLNVVGPVNITGSLTQGVYNQASGSYSHAEGNNTIASGQASHAEGQYSNATGQSSHAEGAGTIASGNASHAEGGGTIASGAQSHAEGLYTDALGSYSHAEGLGADIEYNYSTLSTNANIVFGPVSAQVSSITYNSVAVDGNFTGSISYPYTINDLQLANTEENYYSVVVEFGYPRHNPKPVISSATHNAGLNITTFTLSTPFLDSYASLYSYGYASGSYSHAEGNSAKAIGSYSHAEGRYTVSSGEASHAEGYLTLASGDYSHAAGFYTYAKGAYQSVVGQYNQTSSVDSAFIVGNGAGPYSGGTPYSNLIFAAGSQVQITGSLRVSGSITGSLFGTASYATKAANGGVTSIIAGANVQVSNTTGSVTVSALITNLGLSQAFYQGLQNIF